MARRVLFITDDMQRWDTIGAWAGPHSQYAQTPVIDALARDRPMRHPMPEPGSPI